MKLKNIKVSSSQLDASIQISWLKTERVVIPTRKMMYVFSDPSTWDAVAQRTLEGDVFKELSELIFNMADKDPKTLSEVLLKVAGKHHNAYENETFRNMLAGRN